MRFFRLALYVRLVLFASTLFQEASARDSLLSLSSLGDTTSQKIVDGKPLTGEEQKKVEQAEWRKYKELRMRGYDEVSHTQEAQALRDYRLRKKKWVGLIRRKQVSFSEILFPGQTPVDYADSPKQIQLTTNLMQVRMKTSMQSFCSWFDAHPCFPFQSRRSPISFDVSNHPGFANLVDAPVLPKTLGSGLEGYASAFKMADMFDISPKKDMPCTTFSRVDIDAKKLDMLKFLITRHYRLFFQLDGLPVLMRSRELNYAVRGSPIGFTDPRTWSSYTGNGQFMYNHFRFVVTYQEDPVMFRGVRITGFDVSPVSIKHDESLSTCTGFDVANDPATYLSFEKIAEDHGPVTFSYDVRWEHSELQWADRWDVYFLGLPDYDIHYYCMFQSALVILLTTALICKILVGICRKDIAGVGKKETGWQHVHADVFRPPSSSPMLLSVFVGSGAHLGTAAILTMILNMLNVSNTMVTGSVLTSFVLVYALCGPIGGYVSVRLYKVCGGDDLKRNATLTALAVPGLSLVAFCLVSALIWIEGGATVDCTTLLLLAALFGFVGIPLVFLGDRMGRSAPSISFPTKTSNTIRPVPASKWMKRKFFAVFAGGFVSFASLYLEMQFLMTSLWLKQYCVTLGFLLTATVLTVIVGAQVSILICYSQLKSEDHRWWWVSFCSSATTGVFMGLFSLYYMHSSLALDGVFSSLIYLICMGMASFCVGLMYGSVGFLSCLWFTRTIFGALNRDSSTFEGIGRDEVDTKLMPLTEDYEESLDS